VKRLCKTVKSCNLLFLSILSLAFAGSPVCLTCYAISSERASELIAERNKTSRFDCINRTEEEKAFLLDYLKKQHAKPGYDYEEFAQLEFLQLGDEPTIKRLVDKLHEWPQAWASQELSLLERSGQASVIEAISDVLFREQPFEQLGTDAIGFPASFEVATAMLKIVSDSPQFAPEVRHWANGVKALYGCQKENREIMRKWYRQNEAHFKSHDYRAVQPPVEAPRDDSPVRHPLTNDSLSLPASHPSALSSGNAQTQESSRNWYAWIAALLLAGSGTLVWLLKRNRT